MNKKKIIKRHKKNPVLSAKDIPYKATLIFNPGVAKFKEKYVMIFRNDFGDEKKKKLYGHNLGLAVSEDGIKWEVESKPLFQNSKSILSKAYDPRLTVIEKNLYMCFAYSKNGVCGGIAKTEDLKHWEILSTTVPDNRNIVLFPEKINGMFVRLERPFAGYLRPGDRFDIWISVSPDCIYWGKPELLLSSTEVKWVNNKIGPATPPIKTDKGWLVFFHGVDIDLSRNWGWSRNWNKRYRAGLFLLDLKNPYKIKGFCPHPVMEPEEIYETKGYRDNVIFPTGAVPEKDGSVKIYYGAADTVIGMATAKIAELVSLCKKNF